MLYRALSNVLVRAAAPRLIVHNEKVKNHRSKVRMFATAITTPPQASLTVNLRIRDSQRKRTGTVHIQYYTYRKWATGE